MNIYDHKVPEHHVTEILDALPEHLLITGHCKTRIVVVDGEQLLPDKSLQVINHSPDGFAWGYAGSGPAQLALAILLKYLSDEIACNLYQQFKVNVVSSWPQESFAISINLKEEIEKILSEG